MDNKKYLLTKFRDSNLRVDPGEKVFLIQHDGSIVERHVDYVFCNMDESLSIFIDGEGEFLADKQDICFFTSAEDAKKYRDKMEVDFAIFVKNPQGRYYSTFESNYDFLVRGSIHPETLDFTENFVDFIQDFDYVDDSHYLFLLLIHDDNDSIPFTGYSVYYVVDGKSKKIDYPCLFKVPTNKLQEMSLKISQIDDPLQINDLCSKLFLNSSEIFGS